MQSRPKILRVPWLAARLLAEEEGRSPRVVFHMDMEKRGAAAAWRPGRVRAAARALFLCAFPLHGIALAT